MSESSHPAACSEEELLRACEVIRQRRSGPGGQHRNKVETAIRLKHLPTGITAEATERRSQSVNLSAAVRRLRVQLALDVRQPIREVPSTNWSERCRGGRLHISAVHADFPAMLAEALDELEAADWIAVQAAARLDCTVSQLVKFLRKEPRALQQLNRHRKDSGLPPLR